MLYFLEKFYLIALQDKNVSGLSPALITGEHKVLGSALQESNMDLTGCSSGIIVAYDISNRETFDALPRW